MKATNPLLAGLVTATAFALAVPAAFAAPHAHGKGTAASKTGQGKTIKAAHKSGRAKNVNRLQSIKLAASTQDCSTEYDYVYAGGQCAVVSGSYTTSPLAAFVTVAGTPTDQSCPGEYEYVYAGAQCAPAPVPSAVILSLDPAVASRATVDPRECTPEYDYIYGGNSCNPHR